MRFLYRVCQVYISLGILAIVIATANQVFGFGMFPNGYPAGQTDAQGHSVGSSYGTFMVTALITIAVTFLLGVFFMWRLRRRAEAVAARIAEQKGGEAAADYMVEQEDRF